MMQIPPNATKEEIHAQVDRAMAAAGIPKVRDTEGEARYDALMGGTGVYRKVYHTPKWSVALYDHQRRKAMRERLRRAGLNLFCGRFSRRAGRRTGGHGWRMVQGLQALCL